MVTSANSITLARIALIPVFIALLYIDMPHQQSIAAATFVLIAATDWLDGWIARKQKQVTKVGALLDPLADKLLVSAALIFLIGKGVAPWMAFVIIGREFAVTGLRLVAKEITSASYWGKLKTVSQMVGIVAVILQLPYAWHLMVLAVLLTVLSGIDYFWKARAHLQL